MAKKPRRAERALAFQTLYSLSFTQASSLPAVRRAFSLIPRPGDDAGEEIQADYDSFAFALIKGVWEKEHDLDGVIARFSHNWRVDRIGKTELIILRMAVFELLYRPDVPGRVAINEAMELAKQFGEPSAMGFVSGLLEAAGKELSGAADAGQEKTAVQA